MCVCVCGGGGGGVRGRSGGRGLGMGVAQKLIGYSSRAACPRLKNNHPVTFHLSKDQVSL